MARKSRLNPTTRAHPSPADLPINGSAAETQYPSSQMRIRMHRNTVDGVKPYTSKKSSSSPEIWFQSSSVSFNAICRLSGLKRHYTRQEPRRSVDDGCLRNRWSG